MPSRQQGCCARGCSALSLPSSSSRALHSGLAEARHMATITWGLRGFISTPSCWKGAPRGTTGSALLPKVPLVLVKHLREGQRPKLLRVHSSPPRLLPPPQLLSVLPYQQSEHLSNQFKIYLWSDSDIKKRIVFFFFSQQTAENIQNTLSFSPH